MSDDETRVRNNTHLAKPVHSVEINELDSYDLRIAYFVPAESCGIR